MQEQELFNNYEVKNWEFSPRFYKILAASAFFNILALVVVGQSSLLTTKGCDSPLVGKVCTVIDALYVGGTVLTTESGYVNEPYTPTEFGPDDEITFINVADRLSYPDGYFQLANPELAALQENPDAIAGFDPMTINPTNPTIAGIPNAPAASNPLDRRQVLPKAPKGKVVDDLEGLDPLGGIGENPTTDPKIKPTRPRVTKTPKVDGSNPTVANNDAQKNLDSKDAGKIEINREPLYDLKTKAKDGRDSGQLNFASPFLVQARGKLNDDGKLDAKSVKFTKLEGDNPELVELVKSGVAAVSDAGYLKYLKIISGSNIDLKFSQDGTNVAATLESEMESERRASTVQFYIQQALNSSRSEKEKAIAAMQNDPAKAAELLNEIDDLELIRNATVSIAGKKVVIQFTVPQAVVGKMIERKLNEPDPAEKKPNSSAQIFNTAPASGR